MMVYQQLETYQNMLSLLHQMNIHIITTRETEKVTLFTKEISKENSEKENKMLMFKFELTATRTKLFVNRNKSPRLTRLVMEYMNMHPVERFYASEKTGVTEFETFRLTALPQLCLHGWVANQGEPGREDRLFVSSEEMKKLSDAWEAYLKSQPILTRIRKAIIKFLRG